MSKFCNLARHNWQELFPHRFFLMMNFCFVFFITNKQLDTKQDSVETIPSNVRQDGSTNVFLQLLLLYVPSFNY